MKNPATRAPAAKAKRRPNRTGAARAARIHPVVIYPYRPRATYADLEALYELVGQLDASRQMYSHPITVMDRKTYLSLEGDKRFRQFRDRRVAKCSRILDSWCVDTCQMWYTGLGEAFAEGKSGDVYWLIPGDFNYGTAVGKEVLSRLHDLPEIILELNQDLCIGEIAADYCNPKQLIDTYGTFALLYNWFPAEAQEIRQFTERPRSEFFAVRHDFLKEVLTKRWYPYEQTVVMLLHAVFRRQSFSRFSVGDISDLPHGRESLGSAMQQVERTERVLKAIWREHHESQPNWRDEYRVLESRSEQIRRTALTILGNLLR
jgi:hypothetical protein